MKINEILKDSNYKLNQFSQEKINVLENSITTELDKNDKVIYYINCLVRDKKIRLNPEEVVRQLYLMVLNEDYGYSFERMELEYAVSLDVKRNVLILLFLIKLIREPLTL